MQTKPAFPVVLVAHLIDWAEMFQAGEHPHWTAPLLVSKVHLNCGQRVSRRRRRPAQKWHEQLWGSVLCLGSGDEAGVAKVKMGERARAEIMSLYPLVSCISQSSLFISYRYRLRVKLRYSQEACWRLTRFTGRLENQGCLENSSSRDLKGEASTVVSQQKVWSGERPQPHVCTPSSACGRSRV